MGRHGGHRSGSPARWLTGLSVVVGAVTVTMVPPAVSAVHAAPARLLEGTPCTRAADACVDLASKRAWLIDEGVITRGPVPLATGATGHETPTGDFQVEWKNPDHISGETGTVMPYAVFFAPGGIAFHEGALDIPSAAA